MEDFEIREVVQLRSGPRWLSTVRFRLRRYLSVVRRQRGARRELSQGGSPEGWTGDGWR